MKYSEFIQEFSTVDVCRVQHGFVSECVDVEPGGEGLHTSYFRFFSREGCDSTFSVLRHRIPGAQEETKQFMSRDRDSYALEIFSMSRRGPQLQTMSGFHAKHEVTLEASLESGIEYLLVVRAKAGLGKSAIGGFHVVSYACGSVGLKASSTPEADKTVRAAAFEAQAQKYGDVLWEEDGNSVRGWKSDNGDIFAISFDARKGRLLARFDWTMSNMLLQPNLPEEPEPDLVAAASSGDGYNRQMVVDLQCGQQQVALVSWFQPQAGCEMTYSYSCGTKPCAVCGVPVGVEINGRFSGEYLVTGGTQIFGKTWFVHAECKQMKNLAGKVTRSMRRKKR
jgi:hypothetical protein